MVPISLHDLTDKSIYRLNPCISIQRLLKNKVAFILPLPEITLRSTMTKGNFMPRLPKEWESFLNPYLDLPDFYRELDAFLSQFKTIIPAKKNIFHVFREVSPQKVCCVLYGEDPYPRPSSANGIAFWDAQIKTWDDRTVGNSMKNILKALLVAHGLAEYKTPISECRKTALAHGIKGPGDLFRHWLKHGVLLINVALTFSEFKDKKLHFEFWRPFHLALIKALNRRKPSPFYILWGKKAQQWQPIILESIDDPSKILTNGHPTFIHQFLNPQQPDYSPFKEIEQKTGFSWL